MSRSLAERYDDRIAGVLSCYDRLVITGTLPAVCYAAGMTGVSYSNANGIRIFDYPDFAKTLRDRVRTTGNRVLTVSESAVVERRKILLLSDRFRPAWQIEVAGNGHALMA